MGQSSNTIIERQLDDRLEVLRKEFAGDLLTYIGELQPGVDELVRNAVEDLRREDSAKAKKRRRLCVILETVGGSIDTAERIANILRHHYREVEFIIPSFAMSAGTVLALSGDAIHMDYASVLGPIDPQVPSEDGRKFIPALGYLEQFRRFMRKAEDGTINQTETAYLLTKFDPAELYVYEQALELSESLLKEWLVKYKFKNWNQTRSKKLPVTTKMKQERAELIAKRLSENARWHSHSRGLTMAVLRRQLHLEIEDFEDSPARYGTLREYSRLLRDYMVRRSHGLALHTEGIYVGL